MQFHDYQTIVQVARKQHKRLRRTSDQELIADVLSAPDITADVKIIATVEYRWQLNKRPYYNLWPVALRMSSKIQLDKITGEQLKFKQPVLLARLPRENNPFVFQETEFATLLMAPLLPGMPQKAEFAEIFRLLETSKILPAYIQRPSVLIAVNYLRPLKPDDGGEDVDGATFLIPMAADKTVAESLQAAMDERKTTQAKTLLEETFRLYCLLALIDEDSGLLERIVLNDDREKYEKNPDEKFVEKAIRRGVNGWDVGRSLEATPHLRRAHFAIRWMGHGADKQAVLRPIKAAVVHRDKLKEVPTGYFDDAENQHESSTPSG